MTVGETIVGVIGAEVPRKITAVPEDGVAVSGAITIGIIIELGRAAVFGFRS